MRQSCAKTLVTEEPDEGNLHVRLCGGSTWVTDASTRTISGTRIGQAIKKGSTINVTRKNSLCYVYTFVICDESMLIVG